MKRRSPWEGETASGTGNVGSGALQVTGKSGTADCGRERALTDRVTWLKFLRSGSLSLLTCRVGMIIASLLETPHARRTVWGRRGYLLCASLDD